MVAKYVITSKGPIIFPESIQHSEFKHLNPTSAGQVFFHADKDIVKVLCVGESLSLRLKSDPGDAAIITRQILND